MAFAFSYGFIINRELEYARMTARDLRAANRDAVRFFEDYKNNGITKEVFQSSGNGNVLSFVSNATDQITASVLNDYKQTFKMTTQYSKGLIECKKLFFWTERGMKALAGSFKDTPTILQTFSSFEQMIILEDILQVFTGKLASGVHTLNFSLESTNNCPIKITIAKKQEIVDLLNVTVGHVNYKTKQGLSYERMVMDEDLTNRWVLHGHLSALEMARNPYHSTNLVVKQTARDARVMDNRTCFKAFNDAGLPSKLACAEHKGQRNPIKAVRDCMAQSAFTAAVVAAHSAPQRALLDDVSFDDFYGAGYSSRDDFRLSTTGLLRQAGAVTAPVYDPTSELTTSLQKLTLRRLGPSGSDQMNQHLVDTYGL